MTQKGTLAVLAAVLLVNAAACAPKGSDRLTPAAPASVNAQAAAPAPLAQLAPADAWAAYIGGDYDQALTIARPAAEAGDAGAAALLGYIYWAGVQVPMDRSRAQRWFKKYAEHCGKLAEQGDPTGEQGLGWLHQNGWGGLEQNYAAAARWYRKAAEQGNPYAQSGLGILYHYGLGVENDYAQAEMWNRKSAEQGDPYGQSELGSLYENGLGVAVDHAQAYLWYFLAGAQNNPEGRKGMERLRQFMTQDQLGGTEKEAAKWYFKGAEQGDPYRQRMLGSLYEHGAGVAVDNVEAYKWYFLAGAQNSVEGQLGMKRLRRLMTTAEVSEAQERAASVRKDQ